MIASEAIASGHGRDRTSLLQRRQLDCRGASPRSMRRRSRRVGRTTRLPHAVSSAGSAVSEARSTRRTASTEAIASPYMKVTPVRNIPSNAITTVVPAGTMARPEVSMACTIDASMFMLCP